MSSMRLCLSTGPPHEVCSCSNIKISFHLPRHLWRQTRLYIARKLLCPGSEPPTLRPRCGQVQMAIGERLGSQRTPVKLCGAAQSEWVSSPRHHSARWPLMVKGMACLPRVSCARSRCSSWCRSPSQRCGDASRKGVFRNQSSCRLGSRSGGPRTSSAG